MQDVIYILFMFALGACIGSFLNVVVWRLPRNESLVHPPSHCPACNHLLAWYDNIPVFGWIALGGRCRYCACRISARYPIIEAITGLLFVLYYVVFFMLQMGPRSPVPNRPMLMETDWAIYFLYMMLISGLLACSLIDAELFIIPAEVPWVITGAAMVVHAIFDHPARPGAINATLHGGAIAAGAVVGLGISLVLWHMDWIKTSFARGEPILEQDREALEDEIRQASCDGEPLAPLPPPYTKAQIRGEMRHELLFLFFPICLAGVWYCLTQRVPAIHNFWLRIACLYPVSGMLGSILGALVGAFVVWVTRILGTLGFGKVAMGLGDADLMLAVGAVLGPGPVVIAFFMAPFFGLLVAMYGLIVRNSRELPYGPSLSLASAIVMLCSQPLTNYLRIYFDGVFYMFSRMI